MEQAEIIDTFGTYQLLTKHLEGNHGDGGASGDQSSLRQGAGIGTSANPDFTIATTVEHWLRW